MSDTKKNILVEKINKSETSISISNLAYEMLTPFGLGNDKFVYAATICWLREKLKADMIPTGGKYCALVTDATMEDFFQLVGTEIPVDKFATMDIRFPRVDLAGVYYDMNGNFIKTEGNENEWNSVYVKDENNNIYLCSNHDFIDFSALIYAEALLKNGINEYKSMGEVVKHRMDEKKLSINKILYHKLSGFDALKLQTDRFKKGVSIINYQQKTGELKKDIGYNEDMAIKYSIVGVIHGLLTKENISKDAMFWSHGINRKDPYEKTISYGSCDFWKLTDKWIEEHNNQRWP